jgi:D-glycerate 3-kinase
LSVALKTLSSLDSNKGSIHLPAYDKSAFEGKGDQVYDVSKLSVVNLPIDVILLEGWMLGFSDDLLDSDALKLMMNDQRISIQDVTRLNTYLKEYNSIYAHIDAFICLEAPSYDIAYQWRWEQELSLKTEKHDSSAGMTRDQITEFVDRFAVCYRLYLNNFLKVMSGSQKSSLFAGKRSLTIRINEKRQLLDYSEHLIV